MIGGGQIFRLHRFACEKPGTMGVLEFSRIGAAVRVENIGVAADLGENMGKINGYVPTSRADPDHGGAAVLDGNNPHRDILH